MVGFHQHFFVICCHPLTLLLLGCICIQPASYLTFFRQLYNRRLALPALFCRMRTPRPETASRNPLCRIRYNALNGLKGRTILCNSRNRTHQADCIRMLRIIEKLSNRGFSTIRPVYITMTVSRSSLTTPKSWVMKRTDVFIFSFKSLIRSRICA